MSNRVSLARRCLVLLALAVGGAALTGFYFIHEVLPRPVRAPSSLLLAPVAVVDGACYALGVPGIYGKPFPVFIVNCVAVAAGYLIWRGVRKMWRGAQDA